MQLKKLNPPPEFNREEPFGEIYGKARGELRAQFQQGPHYFAGDGRYVGSDPRVKNLGKSPKEKKAPASQNSKPITEEELPELLKNPRAEELMALPLDKLSQLVAAAGGPAFSGDRALMLYAGWLLKYVDVEQ